MTDIAESGIDGIQGKLVRKTNNTHIHVKLLTRVLKFEPSIQKYFLSEPFSDYYDYLILVCV